MRTPTPARQRQPRGAPRAARSSGRRTSCDPQDLANAGHGPFQAPVDSYRLETLREGLFAGPQAGRLGRKSEVPAHRVGVDVRATLDMKRREVRAAWRLWFASQRHFQALLIGRWLHVQPFLHQRECWFGLNYEVRGSTPWHRVHALPGEALCQCCVRVGPTLTDLGNYPVRSRRGSIASTFR
jgi:hypothetical protein